MTYKISKTAKNPYGKGRLTIVKKAQYNNTDKVYFDLARNNSGNTVYEVNFRKKKGDMGKTKIPR